jgi:uncharacterized protein (TIGR02001 family)
MIAVLAPLASAQAADVSFEGSLGAYSSYIWRGYKLSPDALQLQPSLSVSAAGFSANVWADYDTDNSEWIEADYTASWAHAFDAVSFEVGYIHYDVRDGLDSDELYVSLGYDSFLNPSLTVYADIEAGDGAFAELDISHPIELSPSASLELAAGVSLVMDDSYVAVDERGQEFTGLFNGIVSATGSITLNDTLSLVPMAGYTFALSDDASDAIENGSTEAKDSFLFGAVSLVVSF